MRGLAPDEIALLRYLSTENVDVEAADADVDALEVLVVNRRVVRSVGVDEDGDLCNFYNISDLGRLALRVSVHVQGGA